MTRADSYPIVSVLIPARNEGTRIAACLESILANDYLPDRLELFVIDGASEDDTRVVAEQYARRHACLKILGNPRRIIPAAMNIGIAQARGEIIMKVEAHSRYERDHVRGCVRALLDHGTDCVGGRWLAAIVGVYGLMNLVAAVQLAVQNRRLSNLWAAPVVLAGRHLAHGMGALYGLVLALVPGKRWRGRRTATV